MRLAPLCFAAVLLLGGASLAGAAGCDDAPDDNEAALPGVGPIGAGGAPDFGPGGAGGAGTAGAGGASGAGAGGASGQGGAAGGPACAAGGEGRVRLAAMRARAGKVDVCAAAVPAGGAADFATAARLVRALGDAAHDGLAFGEVASPSSLAAGTWSLKVIDAADADCAGAALATTEFCLTAVDDLTLVLLEDALTRFDNAAATGGNRLRFIHAYAGGPALDVGLTDPGTGELVPPALFVGLAYGTTAPAADSTFLGAPVLASGYLDLPADNDTPAAPVGAAPTGEAKALLATVVDLAPPKGRVLTAYAAGRKDDAAFALRGLLCDETKVSGALTTCLSF